MRRLLIALVVVHVLIAVARVPHAVFAQRLEHVADWRARGPVRFHLDNKHRKGADAVEWILANVPENGVVLHRGERRGAMEFVPALIWPRLLVEKIGVGKRDAEFAGRPIAHGVLPSGASGQIVLVGFGDRVELEVR